MADAHANFAYSTVATAPSPATSGTSLVVAAGQGALFPAVPFNATVWPTAAQPTAANAEIVRVTNISTDTFTITRAQESSVARTVVVGDQIAATITAKTLTDAEAGGWTTVRKASDESVASSTALQADDELVFTAVAGVAYEIQAFIIHASPAGGGTPDIKLGFGEDSTARGTLLGSYISTANAASLATSGLTDQLANWIAGTATTDRAVYLSGVHVGAGGTFSLLWAQNTSGINATIVRAGSVLRYRAIT